MNLNKSIVLIFGLIFSYKISLFAGGFPLLYPEEKQEQKELDIRLASALKNNNKELAKTLKDKGARPDAYNTNGGYDTALHIVALEGNMPMLQWIKDNFEKIDPNPRNDYGQTPLYLAVEAPNAAEIIKALKTLFKFKNIDVNAKTTAGSTALHKAVILGKTDVIDLLMSMGADAFIDNKFGKTPIQDGIYNFEKFKNENAKKGAEYLKDLLKKKYFQ